MDIESSAVGQYWRKGTIGLLINSLISKPILIVAVDNPGITVFLTINSG